MKKKDVERFWDPGREDDKPYQELLERARKTIAMMDAADEKAGFAYKDILMTLRNGMSAISAAMSMRDWNMTAEGFVMLQQLELWIRDALPANRYMAPKP